MTSDSQKPSASILALRRLLASIADHLNKAKLPYMVIGGQAVIHYGETRLTKDIDLTMAIAPFDLDRLLPVFKHAGLKPMVDDPQEWVIKTHVLPFQSSRTSLRIDISFTDSPYEIQAIARGKDVVIEGVPVRFASVEDLVIHKIIAWRGVDQNDVRSILLKNSDIDLNDVRHWLRLFAEALELPLEQRLGEALRLAGM